LTSFESISIEESSATRLKLTVEQATALVAAGRQLASTFRRTDDDDSDDRTVVRCIPAAAGEWDVTVSNAVGVIAVPGVQLVVEPKIPAPHLVYLLANTDDFRAIREQSAMVAVDDSFWQMIARWFVSAVEDVLRSDLIRDYQEVNRDLFFSRGTVDLVATARLYYSGNLAFRCSFDEFSIDTPLNRLLKAASRIVAGSPLLIAELRQRARRATLRMEDVGDLLPGDSLAQTDRRTAHYKAAAAFARAVVQRSGRFISTGESYAWTFLIPTPLLVEEGIRNILRDFLSPAWTVDKEPVPMSGTNRTLNPDLRFGGGSAVGDVKYKVDVGDWRRTDLYQTVAFAAGCHCDAGCIIGFRTQAEVQSLSPVGVGAANITPLSWDARQQVDPSSAAEELGERVAQWLDNAVPLQSSDCSPNC
jgi:5-methylcytosine-specific restriction enzyme subunit McrC